MEYTKGRNLLQRSATFGAADWARTRSTVPETGIIRTTPTTSSALAKYAIDYLKYGDFKNQPLTFSCDARVVETGTYSGTIGVKNIYIGINKSSRKDTPFASANDRYTSVELAGLTTEWTRHSITVDSLDLEYLEKGLATYEPDDTDLVTVEVYSAAKTEPAEFRNIKLELGTEATPWRPAPEDSVDGFDYWVLARDIITVTHVTDIIASTWYYKLQASTASPPAKPTTEIPDGWSTTEPTYTEGSTNSLYVVQKTTFSDDTFEYSDVSLSSSYEAAKTAYNKSVMAQESVDNLAVGGRNLILNTLYPDATGSGLKRPHLIGQITNTSGRGTCTVAEHGIRFTCTSANWQYIYFGSSANTATPCMLGLEAGETYTLSADLSWKVLSSDTGMADATTRHMGAVLYYSTVESGSWHAIGTINQFPITQADKGTEMSGHLVYTFTVPLTAKRLYLGIKADITSASHYAAGDFIEARNLKLERGNRATDWTPAPEDLEKVIEDAKQVATNYVTDITGGGILVHPEDNEEDGVKIHDAIEIIKDGITYIKLWLDGANQDQPKVQVGDSENGAYFLIEKDKLSGKSQSHSYFETGEAGTTVKQVYRGDGINRQFGLYRASSITSVTVNGSAVTNYTLQHDTQTTYGLLTFGENATPSSGASIVIIYETTEQNPYFTFGTRDAESEVELPNGTMSVTFGKKNNASGPCSFAEGSLNTVTGIAGHAEGDSNNVLAHAGHAEGGMNDVTGEYSHAEGYNNTVSGKYSHVGGYGNTAPYNYQTVIGYGAPIASSDDLFMAGNMDVAGERSAAMRLKRSGRVEFGGAVGSGLAWETRTEMINAMTGLSLNRPYSFYAGSSWTSTAGAGSSAAFGIICKTSTTAWHMMFMSGGNIYKTIFTWNGSTSGTFATSQVG